MQTLIEEKRIGSIDPVEVSDFNTLESDQLAAQLRQSGMAILLVTQDLLPLRDKLIDVAQGTYNGERDLIIAEVLVSSVNFHGEVVSLPSSLKPVEDWENQEEAWKKIQGDLKTMLPVASQTPPINKKILWGIGALLLVGLFYVFFGNKLFSPEPTTKETAILNITNPEFDFGRVEEGEAIKHIFEVTNSGNIPINIRDLRCSDRINIARWDKSPLAPGEKRAIGVNVNTNDQVGAFQGQVEVVANTTPPETILRITGHITASEPKPAVQTQSPPILNYSFAGEVLKVTVSEGTPPYQLILVKGQQVKYEQTLQQPCTHRIALTPFRQEAGTYYLKVTDKQQKSATKSLMIDPPSGSSEAEIAETSAWQKASSDNTIASYQGYLERYPGGKYADTAKEKIRKLEKEAKPKYGSVTDPRDGQKYKTIQLAGKTWLAENLNWKSANSWCYDNNPENCKKYGRLYLWEAAVEGCENLGPGWHLPSNEEWDDLGYSFGTGRTFEDLKKAYTALIEGGNSGFNALRAGIYYTDETEFKGLGKYELYWSSTDFSSHISGKGPKGGAYYYRLYPHPGVLNQTTTGKKFRGGSCRCVRD
ncbi:MAG: DUF1573 domain-containing protein [Phaeodactylibacter sp.]|nr:DUF1573 domain-containing protein [Phaeodactylibacter sp.]MCB9304657.1 DUF1573 domain-containing protein [Lewinellaceae bacterium]